MHVLFLYASTGSGHLKAARYVNEALLKKKGDIVVTMADVLNLCHFPVESFIVKTFKLLISKCPKIYRLLYRFTENNALFNHLAGMFFTRSIEELKALCVSRKVSTIACTHPLSLLFASKLKQEMGDKAPVIMGIITDYQIHRFWLYPHIDLYCVPNSEMKEELIQLGWAPEHVRVTGIPCPVDLLREEQDEMEKPFWLVSGGGWGLGKLEATTKSLLKKELPCKLLVVTGENHSLYSRLKTLEKKNPGRLSVQGTLPQLFNVMKNAMCVLTKPGGLTVTEAMILQKPLILLDPLPGAEEKNLHYLIQHRAAVPYRSFIKQPEIIGRWHETFSEGQQLTARTDSSLLIAEWILEESCDES